MNLEQLRREIAMVPQESFLFADTIANNIRFGVPDARPEDIVAAAKLADAHDFILEQPDGYETVVGERGVTLSGGQRQRVTLAQAILMQPRAGVGDATSALDSLTEQRVMQSLEEHSAARPSL